MKRKQSKKSESFPSVKNCQRSVTPESHTPTDMDFIDNLTLGSVDSEATNKTKGFKKSRKKKSKESCSNHSESTNKLTTKETKLVEKCIICSVKKEVTTEDEALSPSRRNQKNIRVRKNEIKTRFNFFLKDCLGLTNRNFEDLGFELSQYEIIVRDAYVCDTDLDILLTGLKIHNQIKELSLELDTIKSGLKEVCINSFVNEEHIGNLGYLEDDAATGASTNYLKFRKFLKTSMIIPESPESSQLYDGNIKCGIPATSDNELYHHELVKIEYDDILDFCEVHPLTEESKNTFENPIPSTSTPYSNTDSLPDQKQISGDSEHEDDDEYQLPEDFGNLRDDDGDDENILKVEQAKLKPGKKKRIRKKLNLTDEMKDSSVKTEVRRVKEKRSRKKRKRSAVGTGHTDLDGSISIVPKQKRRKSNNNENRAKKHQCSVCHLAFLSVEERNSHKDAEHGADFRFACPQCPSQYRHAFDLRCHIRRAHNTDRPFSCDHCSKQFANSGDLKRHVRMQHPAGPSQMLPCPTCGKIFNTPKKLKRHFDVIHVLGGTPKLTMVCEFCGKSYNNHDAFKDHKAKMHLSTYEPSKCDICGKNLSDSRSLKKHKLSQHLKSFQYKCHVCGTGCLYKSHLQAHFKSSHPSLSWDKDNIETKTSTGQQVSYEDGEGLHEAEDLQSLFQ